MISGGKVKKKDSGRPQSLMMGFLWLLCTIGIPHIAYGQAPPDTLRLEIQTDEIGAAVPNLTGFIYFNERLAAPLQQLGEPIIGIDQIFDLSIPITRTADGRITTDFTALGSKLDGIVKHGFRPAVWIDFTPRALSPAPHLDNSLRRAKPPISYVAWEQLVYDTAHYILVEKEISVAYWPVWNEPDFTMFWDVDHSTYTNDAVIARNPEMWNPSTIRQAAEGQLNEVARIIEYMKLYEVTVRAIKRVDPAARVGGPSPSSFNKRWLTTFLNHAVSQNIPVDFIAWHYPQYPEKHAANVRWLRKWTAQRGIALPSIVITEWNANAGSGGDPWIEAVDVIEIAAGMMSSGVEAAFYYTAGQIAEAATGDLTPVGEAFKCLSSLSGALLPCRSAPEIVAVAARNETDEISAVFRHWNPSSAILEIRVPTGYTAFDVIIDSENQQFKTTMDTLTTSQNQPFVYLSLPGRSFGLLRFSRM